VYYIECAIIYASGEKAIMAKFIVQVTYPSKEGPKTSETPFNDLRGANALKLKMLGRGLTVKLIDTTKPSMKDLGFGNGPLPFDDEIPF
jgi:hypothetical protein